MSDTLDHGDVVHHFTARAEIYDRSSHWCTSEDLMEKVVACAAPEPHHHLLDLACGTGLVTRAFSGRVARLVGLDLTPAMAAQAEAALDELVIGQAESMPFADASFDRVTCRQGIQFMDAPKAAAEVLRVLKPGGMVILIDLAAYGEDDRDEYFEVLRLRNLHDATSGAAMSRHFSKTPASRRCAPLSTSPSRMWMPGAPTAPSPSPGVKAFETSTATHPTRSARCTRWQPRTTHVSPTTCSSRSRSVSDSSPVTRPTDPLYIIGTERSGSNLLRVILNAHADIDVPHPPHILKYFHALAPGYGDLKGRRARATLVRDVLRLSASTSIRGPSRLTRKRSSTALSLTPCSASSRASMTSTWLIPVSGDGDARAPSWSTTSPRRWPGTLARASSGWCEIRATWP